MLQPERIRGHDRERRHRFATLQPVGNEQRAQETTQGTGTFRVKRGLAEMLRGGVIMDVVTPEQAKIAEDAGASACASSAAFGDRCLPRASLERT